VVCIAFLIGAIQSCVHMLAFAHHAFTDKLDLKAVSCMPASTCALAPEGEISP